MDFSHLKKLDITDRTADYLLHQIAGESVLVLKPAAEVNKPYFNAVLRKSRKNMRAVRSGVVNQAMIAENREQDRELFPKYVVVGWKNVRDSKGEIVEFNKENCDDFLRALPDWLFDEIRNFAADITNFVGDQPDVEDMAGN
jgi:hypothetical protein